MTISGIILYLSLCFALCLTLPTSLGAFAAVILILLAGLGLVRKNTAADLLRIRLVPLCICLFAFLRFNGLCLSDPLKPILTERFGTPFLLCAASPFFCVGAYPIVHAVWIKLKAFAVDHPIPSPRPQYSLSIREKGILLVISVIAISLFSKNSPLYPFNDWVDIQCFFTMGNAMAHGKVLYRDIYEQKGPLLYMIYGLSCLNPGKEFLGIWLLEIGSCWLFLVNTFRCMAVYIDRRHILPVMPFLAFIVYSTTLFSHGGSCEELCLPALSYCCYLGLTLLSADEVPKWHQSLLIGLSSGCVLWIKFNLLGFYAGWILVPAVVLLRQKQGKALLSMIGWIILGVALSSLPVLGYFLRHHAIADLFTAYFYNNIFVYRSAAPRPVIFYLVRGILVCVKPWFYFPLLVGGLISLFYMTRGSHRREKVHLLMTFGIGFLAIFCISPSYDYYAFILNVSVFYCFLPLAERIACLCSTAFKKAAAAGILCTLCVLSSPNTYLMLEKKSDLPQYQFAEIIQQTPNATLLNYGFLDGGFYMAANTVPVTRFFCQLNIPLAEMEEEMQQCIENGGVDFIVTRSQEIESEHYQLVAESTHYFEDETFNYLLYQRIP